MDKNKFKFNSLKNNLDPILEKKMSRETMNLYFLVPRI